MVVLLSFSLSGFPGWSRFKRRVIKTLGLPVGWGIFAPLTVFSIWLLLFLSSPVDLSFGPLVAFNDVIRLVLSHSTPCSAFCFFPPNPDILHFACPSNFPMGVWFVLVILIFPPAQLYISLFLPIRGC